MLLQASWNSQLTSCNVTVVSYFLQLWIMEVFGICLSSSLDRNYRHFYNRKRHWNRRVIFFFFFPPSILWNWIRRCKSANGRHCEPGVRVVVSSVMGGPWGRKRLGGPLSAHQVQVPVAQSLQHGGLESLGSTPLHTTLLQLLSFIQVALFFRFLDNIQALRS